MKRQAGFTIIEIIIVVIILGLLAATALPRFLDTADEAEDVQIEAVAGGFATAVGMVRGQWEIAGRPSGSIASGSTGTNQANLTYVIIDNKRVGIDGSTVITVGSGLSRGYPTAGITGTTVTSGTANDTRVVAMSDARCLEVFNSLLQSPPAAVVFATGITAATIAENKFVARAGTAGVVTDVCFYYQTAGLPANFTLPTTLVTSPAPVPHNYFYYNPANGEVKAVRGKV